MKVRNFSCKQLSLNKEKSDLLALTDFHEGRMVSL